MTTQVAAQNVLAELESDGIVVLPDFVAGDVLQGMQRAFEVVLSHQRWNDIDGYEKTDPYRHMVQHVLTLDQGFVDTAVHPVVTDTLREFIGPGFQLVEAKGWKSVPTLRDFHGWHGDAWYDQTKVTDTIPREVKLALYLTDVSSGFFEYVRASHRKAAPRMVGDDEVAQYPASEVVQAKGRAGTAILFDTSGIHRQSVPMLEQRWAVFYNYHDPSVPLQEEDVLYNRYHPLVLNAAFLGDLGEEGRRVLGFGDKRNYHPGFRRRTAFRRFHALIQSAHHVDVRLDELGSRVSAKMRHLFGGGR
jgi:hypothetical protein